MSYIEVEKEFLRSLIDDAPCEFDHHGGCQAHGYLSLESGEMCPQQQLKDITKPCEPCDNGRSNQIGGHTC